jgi:hypothetical protein
MHGKLNLTIVVAWAVGVGIFLPFESLAAPAAESVPARVTVTGRVLDPSGKPVPNAKVMVYARDRVPRTDDATHSNLLAVSSIGRGTADNKGVFRVEVPRTSFANQTVVGAISRASRYGAGWITLDPDDEQPTGEITLRPERVIEGRLLDLQGQPAAGVEVIVTRLLDAVPLASEVLRARRGLFWGGVPGKDLHAWPGPAVTNSEGRFTLHGVGKDLQVTLLIHDPRYAPQQFVLTADSGSDSKPVSLSLEPRNLIEGRVTCADTGQPMAHARIGVLVGLGEELEYQTDAEGRFRANAPRGPSGRLSIHVEPAPGQPYLGRIEQVPSKAGELVHRADVALPRGVEIFGKVTEKGTGAPIDGANVYFHATADTSESFRIQHTVTGPDGTYRFGTPQVPGYLAVDGRKGDYVLRDLGTQIRDITRHCYVNAIVPLDLQEDSTRREINVALQRGVAVEGRVLDPKGEPVESAAMICELFCASFGGPRLWVVHAQGTVHGGRFRLSGLDPNRDVPVSFLEANRKLGATIRFPGKSAANGSVTLRLEPCGTVQIRLVDKDKNPIAKFPASGDRRLGRDSALLWMIVSPGVSSAREYFDLPANSPKDVKLADKEEMRILDPVNYGNEMASNDQGRLTFPALIPGATYRLFDPTATPSSRRLRKEFVVKAGETLDLGDILIEKPPQ